MGQSTAHSLRNAGNPDGMLPASIPQIIVHRLPWFIVAVVLCLGAAAGYLRMATPLYTSSSRLAVQPGTPRVIGETQAAPSAEEVASQLNMEKAVITSAPVIARAWQVLEHDKMDCLRGGQAALREGLRVGIGRKDNVIVVEFDAPHPKEACAVVSTVVDAYIAHTAAQGQKVADELLKILQTEKTACEGEIAAKNNAIMELKKAAGTVSFDTNDNVVMRNLQSMRESCTAAHVEAVSAKVVAAEATAAYSKDPEKLRQLEEVRKTGGIAVNSTVENTQIKLAIADAEQKLSELLRSDKGAQNPEVRTLQARLDYLRALYVVAAERWATVAEAREKALSELYEQQMALARSFAEKAAEYGKLDAELKRLERQSDTIDARIREVQASKAAGALKVRVLEPADVPEKPSKPSWLRVLLAALAAGMLLGTGLACTREWTDRRLHSPEQAKALVGLPVLGIIPRVRSRKVRKTLGQIVRLAPRSDVAEAYCSLRAAVALGSRCGGGARILVTSPSAGEGKSTTVSNIAVALARSGRRVLVVDADLRRPTQHRIFAVENAAGLSSVLSGDAAIEEVIQRTSIEGLDLLACGPAPANPAELLGSDRLAEALNAASAKYDMVLIDSPPAASFSDSRVIAATGGSALLVVRIEKTDRRLAMRTRDGLLSVGANLLGLIVNGAARRASHDYSYFEAPASAGSTSGASAATRVSSSEPM